MITHGDIGDKFYIILKGVVSVKVPNPAIKNRYSLWKEYQQLKEWKENVFDLRVRQAEKKRKDSILQHSKTQIKNKIGKALTTDFKDKLGELKDP